MSAVIGGWNLILIVPKQISIKLFGRSRIAFTAAVTILLPLVLATYFLKGMKSFDFDVIIKTWVSWYVLVPVLIVVFISKALMSSFLDKRHPVTGMLVASCVLFLPIYFAYHGHVFPVGEDGYSSDPIDPAWQKAQVESGAYLVRYLVYVVLSLGAMLYVLVKEHLDEKRWKRDYAKRQALKGEQT